MLCVWQTCQLVAAVCWYPGRQALRELTLAGTEVGVSHLQDTQSQQLSGLPGLELQGIPILQTLHFCLNYCEYGGIPPPGLQPKEWSDLWSFFFSCNFWLDNRCKAPRVEESLQKSSFWQKNSWQPAKPCYLPLLDRRERLSYADSAPIQNETMYVHICR